MERYNHLIKRINELRREQHPHLEDYNTGYNDGVNEAIAIIEQDQKLINELCGVPLHMIVD